MCGPEAPLAMMAVGGATTADDVSSGWNKAFPSSGSSNGGKP